MKFPDWKGWLRNLGGGKKRSSASPNYGASAITNVTANWLGDLRSADAWMRFDFERVRARSRMNERGNPYCQSFSAALINNVLGAKGVKFQSKAETSKAYGDNSEGESDDAANVLIEAAMAKLGKEENFTVTKNQCREDADAMLLQRLAFDGEILLRKVPGFDNEFKFAWQFIESDYLDHNLNRMEPNGNIIRMGVEMDPVWRFPVAYWFLNRRPNDDFYGYQQSYARDIYQRIPADQVRHIFIRYYPEQTRGWPWLFAAVLSLHMMGKYHEAALVNALVGASKMGFYKKTMEFPEGFQPDIDPKTGRMFKDDNGAIIDQVEPGSWVELPYGVEIEKWDPTYPHEQFGPFNEAALYAVSAAAKMSYMSLTGDVSKANFSSLRHGVNGEREQWMTLQEFWIRKWKKPGFDEELYRAMLSGQLRLPMGKFDKFNRPEFTGRRWGFVTPVQDWQAKMMQVDMCAGSISAIIKEQGADPWETFKEISQEQKWMKELGIARVHSTYQLIDMETDTAAPADTPPKKLEPASAE